MKTLQLPATIESISSRVDGTWSIKIGTQELTSEQGIILLELNRKIGWFLFKEAPLEEADIIDIPEVKPEFGAEKSPSQKMRNIIYRIWEKNTNKQKPFPDYYKSYMFKLNEMLKEKI